MMHGVGLQAQAPLQPSAGTARVVKSADRAVDILETLSAGGDVVYLAKRQSTHPVSLVSAVGSRLPAHATALGKALWSERTTEEIDHDLTFPLPAVTPRTIRSRRRFLEELAAVRAHGYAVDDEEMADHLRCYAVALPWAAPATDAMSASLPTFRLRAGTEAEVVRLLAEVRDQARRQAPGPAGA